MSVKSIINDYSDNKTIYINIYELIICTHHIITVHILFILYIY